MKSLALHKATKSELDGLRLLIVTYSAQRCSLPRKISRDFISPLLTQSIQTLSMVKDNKTTSTSLQIHRDSPSVSQSLSGAPSSFDQTNRGKAVYV